MFCEQKGVMLLLNKGQRRNKKLPQNTPPVPFHPPFSPSKGLILLWIYLNYWKIRWISGSGILFILSKRQDHVWREATPEPLTETHRTARTGLVIVSLPPPPHFPLSGTNNSCSKIYQVYLRDCTIDCRRIDPDMLPAHRWTYASNQGFYTHPV